MQKDPVNFQMSWPGGKKKWHHEASMVISNCCHFTANNIYRHSKEIWKKEKVYPKEKF